LLVVVKPFLMHSRDTRQAIDAIGHFAQPQGDLPEKLFMLRELLLMLRELLLMLRELLLMLRELLLMLRELLVRSLFVLAVGEQQHLNRFGQGFVALYQPVQPLVDGHHSIVSRPK
jgi:hypothetical protein